MDLAMDASGKKMVAVEQFGNIWLSSDGGKTWREVEVGSSSEGWFAVTASSDGKYLAAVVRDGNVWRSSDSGDSWIEDTSVGESKRWQGITSSSDGSIVAAIVAFGNVWMSSDYGASFVEVVVDTGEEGSLRKITSSSSGAELALVVEGGNVWTTVEPSCTDDDAWTTTRNGKSVGCDWVEAWAPRCQAKGTMPSTKGKVYARYACAKACGTPCNDSTSWSKLNDPLKTCAWVSSEADKRCDVRGQGGTPAHDACPVACGGN
mmetsp:Transcript_27573/g.85692  ORF Transcript_27573/g.85692 Transcript_27573/m.85692 type:complete len:262 (-) Transcript_27573:128-913(-)